MLSHIINDFLNGNVDIVFDDSLVYISNHALNDSELLEQFAARIQDLLGENVLLTVDPEVGEPLLSGVEDLSEVAQRALLVENLVAFGELLSLVSGGTDRLVDFTKPFDLIQETFARTLAIFRVQVIFFIGSLFQVVTHHHCVFEEQKVGGASVLLNLGQGTGWCC